MSKLEEKLGELMRHAEKLCPGAAVLIAIGTPDDGGAFVAMFSCDRADQKRILDCIASGERIEHEWSEINGH